MHEVAADGSAMFDRLREWAARQRRICVVGWDSTSDESRREITELSATTSNIVIADANDDMGQIGTDHDRSIYATADAVAVLTSGAPDEQTRQAGPLHEAAKDCGADIDLLYVGRHADFAAVVALHKSGTHLIGRFMENAGYHPFGNGIQKGPPPGGYEDWPSWEESELDSLPENTVYFSHTLPLVSLRKPGERYRRLLKLWIERDFPLVFHYRDPRAVLSSVMRYSMNRIVGSASFHSAWIKILGEILAGLSNDVDRLTATMELMPDYMNRQYRDNLWMLRHPQICRTSYEGLAGEKAGGCEQAQLRSVARLMVHLGIPGCPRELASSIYAQDVRTFARGRINGWIEDFNDSHLRDFEFRYGDIRRLFGYCETPFLRTD